MKEMIKQKEKRITDLENQLMANNCMVNSNIFKAFEDNFHDIQNKNNELGRKIDLISPEYETSFEKLNNEIIQLKSHLSNLKKDLHQYKLKNDDLGKILLNSRNKLKEKLTENFLMEKELDKLKDSLISLK